MFKKYIARFNISPIVTLGLIITFACVPFIAKSSFLTPQLMRWKVGDTTREALIYIPETAKIQATPVIFVFHGHGGNMKNMMNSRGFEKLWPEAIVIYPQGLNTPGQLTDPQGKLPGWQKTPGDMNDRDLHFFDEMFKSLKKEYKVDEKRIYATGHSNGGGFTYLLWATRADVFAAFAPSAAVGARIVNQLKPKPAMHIMGEKDPLVKTEWQKTMCEKILKIDNTTSQGQTYAPNATFYPSPSGTPVVLYVHPGGHVYPQEADEVVVKFFKSMVKE